MTFKYATVKANSEDKISLEKIREWLVKWRSNMPLRLEKWEDKHRVFEVMAPPEAFNELPEDLVREGIEW